MGEQKYEWDVHPCKIKYSLEARLQVPFETDLKQCWELADMFPRAKQKIPEESLENYLTHNDLYTGWWYEFEQYGTLPDGITDYKTSITLEYSSKEDALDGNVTPIGTPEWSIRIWSSNHGTGQWYHPSVLDINRKYFKIVEFFGTPDYPCKDEYDMENLEL